ncbi:MAG: DUF1385 domain-containing protein [Peptococcaceae bacterium]|nr:DUF1385 domain-containing protein [Peptococcaceae bacterium]
MQVLGGQAFPNGVKFISASHIAKATRDKATDTITIKKTTVPYRRVFNVIRRIPVLRGATILFQMNLKLMVILLLISLLGSVTLAFIPNETMTQVPAVPIPYWTNTVAYFLLVLAIVAGYFGLSDVWRYHGAEHKTFNAYKDGQILSIENVRKYSRVCDNCGTNMLMFVWPVMFLLAQIPDSALLQFFLGLGIGYELFKLKKFKQWTVPFYKAGGLIQKYIVTKEPSDKQIEVAIAALLTVERLG